MNDKDIIIEELQRRGYFDEKHIRDTRWILAKREAGESSVMRMEQCKCWNEVSCLNDETAEWAPVEVWMYNFTGDEGGMIQVRQGSDILETIQIHHCPICGRFLG